LDQGTREQLEPDLAPPHHEAVFHPFFLIVALKPKVERKATD
jgi:hypothetical protein